jgi:hypothetical protein
MRPCSAVLTCLPALLLVHCSAFQFAVLNAYKRERFSNHGATRVAALTVAVKGLALAATSASKPTESLLDSNHNQSGRTLPTSAVSEPLTGTEQQKQPQSRSRKLQQRKEPPMDRAEAAQTLQKLVADFRRAQMSAKPQVAGAPEPVGLADFVAYARRCLHSKLPEFAVEAYSLYKSAFSSGAGGSSTVTRASRDTQAGRSEHYLTSAPLLLCTMRAHLMMRNVYDALVLLQQARAHGVALESHNNCMLIVG